MLDRFDFWQLHLPPAVVKVNCEVFRKNSKFIGHLQKEFVENGDQFWASLLKLVVI